jgi:hypothetical protein
MTQLVIENKVKALLPDEEAIAVIYLRVRVRGS